MARRLTRPISLSAAAICALSVVSSCSSSHDNSATGTSTSVGSGGTTAAAVTIGAVTVRPNPDSVLSFWLRFDTSRPAIVTLHTQGPDGERTAQPERTAALQHNVPVVDLRAQSTYDAWVTVDNGANTTTSNKVKLTTGALPRDFPPMTTKSDPTRMAPGVTLFTITSLVAPPPEPGVAPPLLGNLVAVDATGHVVWYHRDPLPIGDARMIANGDLLYEYNNMGAREIDIMGHLVHEWAGRLERGPLAKDEYGRTVAGTDAIPVDVDSMHHEVSELPNGDILTISTELLTIGGFTKPACGEPVSTFTGHYTVITDMIVEFQPGTGKVVQRWPLVNVLHPATNPADGPICGPSGIPPSAYPLFLYPGRNALDWTHVNAVILDQTHNELLVSIRHLDTVMALRYHTDASGPAGQMIWRFGPRATDFKMTGNGLWQYHQHAIELEHDGTLQMFDNGNDRPGTKELFSRAVRYKIVDTGPKSQWTATQVWEFRPTIDGTPVYAFFVGDADTLPNGNVLIDSGGITPAIKKVVAQIVEVVPASSGSGGDVVFDLRVSGPPAFVYRAERLPSMYGASERDS